MVVEVEVGQKGQGSGRAGFGGREPHMYGGRRPREEERKKTRKTQQHMKQEQLNMRQESRVKPLVEPCSFECHKPSANTTIRLQMHT